MRINECDGKAAIVHLAFCSQVLTFADKCNATWRLISWHHQACVACCPERLLAEFGGNQPAHDDMHPRTANDGPHDLMHEATRAAHSPVHLSRLDGRQLQQLNRLVLHITARSGRTTNTARKERRTTPTRRGLFRSSLLFAQRCGHFKFISQTWHGCNGHFVAKRRQLRTRINFSNRRTSHDPQRPLPNTANCHTADAPHNHAHAMCTTHILISKSNLSSAPLPAFQVPYAGSALTTPASSKAMRTGARLRARRRAAKDRARPRPRARPRARPRGPTPHPRTPRCCASAITSSTE